MCYLYVHECFPNKERHAVVIGAGMINDGVLALATASYRYTSVRTQTKAKVQVLAL